MDRIQNFLITTPFIVKKMIWDLFHPYLPTLKSMTRYLKSFTKSFRNGDVLDIGCSFGALLFLLKKEGANVYGCEPDSFMVELGRRQYNLKLAQTLEYYQHFQEKKFDWIFASHVFEHFRNPIEDLLNIKSMLKKKGILFVEVPNTSFETIQNEKSAGWMGAHLYFFNLKSFMFLIKKAGGEIINYRQTGKTLNDYHKTNYSQKQSNSNIKMKIKVKNYAKLKLIKRLPFLLNDDTIYPNSDHPRVNLQLLISFQKDNS